MISIVCWKWDNGIHPKKHIRFTTEHVNVLRASVERHYPKPHRFICVTDNRIGLHSSIEYINIDDHFSLFKEHGGCYRRLQAFDHLTGMTLFGNRFISLDLDVVVTGNLTAIFDFQDDFKIWEDSIHRRTPYCGSLWGMKAGARVNVWSDFLQNPDRCIHRAKEKDFVGTDQAHISACLWPNEKTWTIADGIYNFNTSVRVRTTSATRRGKEIEIKTKGIGLPVDAKLVFFNGKYDPSHIELQRKHPWIRDHWHA